VNSGIPESQVRKISDLKLPGGNHMGVGYAHTTTSIVAALKTASERENSSAGNEGWLLRPVLDESAAMYGLAGGVVRAGVYTNVEPAGLLMSFLTCVATCMGSASLRMSDGEIHPARLFSVLVGSSRARKGAVQHAKKFFAIDGTQQYDGNRANLAVDS